MKGSVAGFIILGIICMLVVGAAFGSLGNYTEESADNATTPDDGDGDLAEEEDEEEPTITTLSVDEPEEEEEEPVVEEVVEAPEETPVEEETNGTEVPPVEVLEEPIEEINHTIVSNHTFRLGGDINDTWEFYRFEVLGSQLGELNFFYYCDFNSTDPLFYSMYIVCLEGESLDVYYETNVFAGEGEGIVGSTGNILTSGFSEWSTIDGLVSLRAEQSFFMGNGTWAVVFQTNANCSTSMNLTLPGQIKELDNSSGNGCFAYTIDDFEAPVSDDYVNGPSVVIDGVKELSFNESVFCHFSWDTLNSYLRNGEIRLHFTGPDEIEGQAVAICAPQMKSYDYGPRWSEPIIGPAGDWDFTVESDMSGIDMFLVGAEMGLDYGEYDTYNLYNSYY